MFKLSENTTSKMRFHLQILITVAIVLAGSRKGVATTFTYSEVEPVQSFPNENGGIIDCIDIYKQPALKNPLLTGHKIQMQPSSLPRTSENRDSETAVVETVDCPFGTVPIPRTSLQNGTNSRHRFLSPLHDNPNTAENPEQHYAVIAADESHSMPFYGVSAWLNVYHLDVSSDQYSESLLRLENGVNKDAIQFGWNVDPQLYNDSDTHLFGYWTADGFKTTGCYNTLCPGFVQVHRKLRLGAKVSPLSTYGGQQYVLDTLLYKDPGTLNWWVLLKQHGSYQYMGYWPSSLFTGLADHATYVFIGGSSQSPLTKPPPPMGSGHFVLGDEHKTCYISDLKFLDAKNQFVLPDKMYIEEYSDEPVCYGVHYEGDVGRSHNYTMIFGGPGGAGCLKAPAVQVP